MQPWIVKKVIIFLNSFKSTSTAQGFEPLLENELILREWGVEFLLSVQDHCIKAQEA